MEFINEPSVLSLCNYCASIGILALEKVKPAIVQNDMVQSCFFFVATDNCLSHKQVE